MFTDPEAVVIFYLVFSLCPPVLVLNWQPQSLNQLASLYFSPRWRSGSRTDDPSTRRSWSKEALLLFSHNALSRTHTKDQQHPHHSSSSRDLWGSSNSRPPSWTMAPRGRTCTPALRGRPILNTASSTPTLRAPRHPCCQRHRRWASRAVYCPGRIWVPPLVLDTPTHTASTTPNIRSTTPTCPTTHPGMHRVGCPTSIRYSHKPTLDTPLHHRPCTSQCLSWSYTFIYHIIWFCIARKL